METLENIARKKLQISQKILVPDIVSFIYRFRGCDMSILPYINFKNTTPHSMTSPQVIGQMKYYVLFVRKVEGIYGEYYHLYCKRSDDEYLVIRSNKKINKEINDELESTGTDLYLLKNNLCFTPVSTEYIEKVGVVYRDIYIY